MSGALPAFQSAADLGPSPSREAELEDLCSRLAAENEQLRDAADQPVQQARPAQAGIKPEERQALIQLLSDLGGRIDALDRLTAKQGKQIEDLQKEVKANGQEVYEVHDLAKYCLQSFSKRLSSLEDGTKAADAPSVKSHLDNLYDHMKAVGRKQVIVSEAAKILGISRQRVHQFKPEIAQDQRFVLLNSENHKKRMLIRLREYYQKT